MTELEKLMELIKPYMSGLACGDESGACELTNCRDCKARQIANDILANGVIVPPCKVGDTVYIIDEADGYEEESEPYALGVEVLQLFVNKNGIALDLKLPLGMRLNTWAVVGKNVFLTKEDAEKALAERSEGK